MAKMHRSLSVSANGLQHHVIEWRSEKPEANQTVVLLHGFLDAAQSWDDVAERLRCRRVLAPDVRGFGAADRVGAESWYHFPDYILDLIEVLDEAAPGEPVALVGHSMGGAIATLAAGAFPGRFDRVALLEGVGPPDSPHDVGPERMRHWIEGAKQLRARASRAGSRAMTRDEALARLTMNHPTVARSTLEAKLAALAVEGEGGFAWRFDPRHRLPSPMPFFSTLFCSFAEQVTCPVLFVSGGPTGYHPVDEEERLRSFRNLSRATLDSGHMMHWTRPRELADVLNEFLRRPSVEGTDSGGLRPAG